MNHIDKELDRIKNKVGEMWDVVEFQVKSGEEALVTCDKLLAKKIIKEGKKVDAYDLKIDRMCENLLALYNPLAVDLRLILAILKINANLERIGDMTEGVANLILDSELPYETHLTEVSRVVEMYKGALQMFSEVKLAFKDEDTKLARQIMRKDKNLDKIYRVAEGIIGEYILQNPDNIAQSLKINSIIKKLERIGDHATNIAEEIVFYVDAKVVKHKLNQDKTVSTPKIEQIKSRLF